MSSVSKLLHSVFKDLASEEENETCVILPDMDENDITILLKFLYTGSVDLESNHQHVLKVLKTRHLCNLFFEKPHLSNLVLDQVLNPQRDVSCSHSIKLIYTYISPLKPLAEVNQGIYAWSY